MGKIRQFFLTTLVLLCSALTSWAQTTFLNETGTLKFTVTNTTNNYVSVKKNSSPTGELEIPGTVKYPDTEEGVIYTVTSIANEAFKSCSGLTKVTIPETVTSIGEYAFQYCTNLSSVNIPEAVTSIGKYAFWSCKPTSITIPEGVKNIGEAAFYNCKSLETVHFNATNCTTNGNYSVFRDCSSLATFEFGENVETIPAVLQNCNTLSTITIPASVKSIGKSAFYSCPNLTSVIIPEGVTTIGQSAFSQCSGLTSITIPEGVTSIGQSAFFGCSGLTTVNFNATNCTSIGNYSNTAFKNCSQLTTVNIGDNVAAIPDYAFYGCTGLTDINFGSSVRSIGSAAFGNCTSLTSVTVPDEITTIGNSAFQSVKNVIYHGNATGSPWGALNVNATIDGDFIYADAEKTNLAAYIGSGGSVVIPDAVTTIGNSAFHSCTGLTSITFGSSVTTIGSTAFGGCTGLTEVTVPNTVTSIGNGAFAGCSSLQSITLPFVGDKPHQPTDAYQYPLGYIFGGNGTQITQSYIGSSPNELTFNYFKIPSSLESVTITDCNYIAPYALSNLTMLKSLTIPETVTTIGNNAFNGCSNLQTLTYNTNAITTQFKNFYYLKTVNIGNTVTAISDEAFSGCENLRSVSIPNSVESIGSNAFDRTALQGTKADGDNLYYLGNSENPYLCLYKAESTDIATCAINSGCTLIYDNALANCTALTEITVSDGVTSIGQNAFLNIKNVIYHGNATGSPWGALMVNGTIDGDFIYADAEKTIIAAYIGGGGSVAIPDAVTTIGNSAFSSCTGLTAVTFGNGSGLTTIGENAFKGCTGLTAVTVPNTVTSIGSGAFGGCSGLQSISLPFVGDQQHQPTDACQYPLGYIFGSDSYEGGTETWQSYTGSPWNGTKYYIPTSLTSVAITNGSRIPNGAFYSCRNITSVSLPNTLESIGSNAFYYCDNLASVNIPDNCTDIGSYAFQSCSGLTSVNIPDNCTTINAGVFVACTSLTSITIPDAVTAIGASAFGGCTGLASLTVPNTVETIGSNAFYKIPKVFYAGNAEGCPWGALKVVGVIDGDFVYSDAAKTNLVEYAGEGGAVTIPETVRSIDNNAFEGCTGLTAVTFNSGITTIGKNAFEGCTGLTQVNIPEGAETIDNYAFKNCTGLTSVVIPKSVTSVGIGAFSGCSSLESITLPFVGNTPKQPDDAYQYPFGYIFGYNSYEGGRSVTQKWYQSYIGDIQNYSCYIPETLREVNVTNCSHLTAYAFYGCSMLTTITLPNTLESVGLWAFPSGNGFPCSLQRKEENGVKYLGNSENEYLLLESAATDITECEISSRCKIINWAAFFDCTNLSSIEIPSSVTYIGEYAFSGCTGLTSVVVPQSVKSIGTGAFKGCSSLEAITLPFVGEKQYLPSDEYQYAFGHIFGEQGYTDGMCINQYCAPQSNWQKYYYIPSTLRSVTITGSNYISYGAFSNCSMLTTINIPNTVENIGERAFYGCTALQTYTEDEYANYLGNSENHFVCLYQAKSTDMAAFQIHSGCNVVYHDALSGCGSLAAIIIPETVACVGQQAFMNCSSATIYCEAEQKPDDWYADWNNSNRPVEWGCKAIKVVVNNADWGAAVATGHAVVAPDGSQWFKNNTEMTLTATPNTGYHFVKWTEDGSEESNRTFVPAHSGTYTAEFSNTPYDIVYMVDGEEYQKVEGIPYGTAITLIDEPAARHGYTFSGWSELPETMPAHNVTVEGTFVANLHNITYLVDAEEYQKFEDVAYGTALSLIDEPTLVGHTFSGWSTLPETMPDEDVTVEGAFSINSYNISVGGENGIVTGDGVYVFNTTATLEATAATGYHFVAWIDGVTDNPRTVTVKSDSTFTATFAAHVDSVAFENIAAATCTVAGSYDSVVYCSICKEELSRDVVNVPAAGHKADSVVFENVVAATRTAAGSYDSVVYCSVCRVELSRTTVNVPQILAESIKLASKPNKVDYKQGEALDVKGGKITIGYTDKSTEDFEILAGWVSGFDSQKVGEQKLTVTFESVSSTLTTTFNVTVSKEDDNTAIDEYAANKVNIYAYQNVIVVENATDEIDIYNAMGALVCRDAARHVSTATGLGARTEIRMNTAGIYIVKVGNVAKRVMIND